MKVKDKQAMRQLAKAELSQKLTGAQKEFVEAKWRLETGEGKDVHLPGKKRKEIARLKTWLTEKGEEK